ncbi:unnamed protein product, partial [Musa acuminata var. zebrina]
QDTKKSSVGRNAIGGGGIVAAVVEEVMVDNEGRGPGPGWSAAYLRRGSLLALIITLVFFLTVAEGGSDGGVGDELALGWIPIGSNCHESIAKWLTGDDFELRTKATRRILACSYYINYNALRRDSVSYSRSGASYYNCCPSAQANPYSRSCSAITCCQR